MGVPTIGLDAATAEPISLPLAGGTYQVKPRTLAELAPLQAWFRESIPGPLLRTAEALEQARRLKIDLGSDVRNALLDAAHRESLAWPPMLLGYYWRRAVDDAGHAWKVVHCALQPCHPSVTEEEARRLVDASEPGELGTIAYVLRYGAMPEPIDPKAEAGTATPTTT
jgi:hypothetical protein